MKPILKIRIRITKYTGNADCVQIPAEIDGAPVVSLGPYVFVEIADAGKGTFKAVVATNGDTTPREIFLPETLRYISYCAFMAVKISSALKFRRLLRK